MWDLERQGIISRSGTLIAQNDNMVSINSCVQVDLMGQVASESIGYKQISGTGGQVDFVRGAARSKGGRAIIAMPSTVKGKISKMVPLLDEGLIQIAHPDFREDLIRVCEQRFGRNLKL